MAPGSTCLSSEITIEAKDSGGTTITDYAGTVTLSTSTANGDWSKLDEVGGPSGDPAQGVLTPGAADSGSATYVFVPGVGVGLDGGDIALFLANQHAESLTITVDDLGAGVSSTSVLLAFSENAFVITPTTCSGASCPGIGSDTVVARRDHVFHIQMVRRDISLFPPVCGVATNYTGVQDLKAWIVRDVEDPSGTLPTLAEETAALGDGAPPAADNLQLDFTALPGESDFTLETTDVGKFVLNVRDDSGSFASGNIDGATNALVVRPFGYDIAVIGNPAATGPAGAGFVAAGTNLTVSVRGVGWQAADDDGVPVGIANDGIPDGHETGDTDPSNNSDLSDNAVTVSYGQESPAAEAVDLSALLNQPAVFDPGLTGGTLISVFVAGSGSTATARYDEVGIMEIRASLPGDGVYLGADPVVGVSGFVGRFFPNHFRLAASTITNRSASVCAPPSTFTYLDEVFNINYTLNAENVFGTVTRNYDGAFANLPITIASMNFGAVDTGLPVDLSARLSVASVIGGWTEGVAVIDSNMGLNRAAVVDGPFDAFNVGIAPVDPVDSVGMDAFDLDVDLNATDDHTTLGATVQRFGRLNIESTFGSEVTPLNMPMQTEFFDGANFVLNTDDGCTALAPTDLILNSAVEGPETDGDIFIVAGGLTVATVGNNPLVQGEAALSFSPPGATNVGFTDVTTDLSTLGRAYLLYDWDGDGNFDNDPLGRATFGIFQGPRVIIYRREPGI